MGDNGACCRVSAQALLCISGNKEVKFHSSQRSVVQLPHLILQFPGTLELRGLSCYDFVLSSSHLTHSFHLKIWAYSLHIKDGIFRFYRKNFHGLFLATAPIFLSDCLLIRRSYFCSISLPLFSLHLGLSLRMLKCSYSWPRCHRQPNITMKNR